MTPTPRADHAVVPVEPTPAMLKAGTASNAAIMHAYEDAGWADITSNIWSAMLAAAPKPAMAGSKEVRDDLATLLGSWVIHAGEDPEDGTVLHDQFVGDHDDRTAELYRLTDAILALIGTAEGRDDVLWEAAQALVNKLATVHEHPVYKHVWQTAQMHSGPYVGPTYTDELSTLRAALSTPEER